MRRRSMRPSIQAHAISSRGTHTYIDWFLCAKLMLRFIPKGRLQRGSGCTEKLCAVKGIDPKR